MSPEPAAAYRLNWNPQIAPDDVTQAEVEEFEREGAIVFHWRCGNATIEVGRRIFLVRTGTGPRGIIGAGCAVREPDGGFMDDDGEWNPRAVDVRFHILSLEPLVERAELNRPPLDQVHWSNATAAARLTAPQAAALEELLKAARPRVPGPRLTVVDPERMETPSGPTADYARLHPSICRKAVLLPEEPHVDLLGLLKSQEIDAIWEGNDGFLDTAGGRLAGQTHAGPIEVIPSAPAPR